jgi:hypothetical protein
MGRLTMLNNEQIYSTWKITLRRISVYFRPYDRQYWNRHYRIAQTIFNGSFRSIAKQNSFKFTHKLLYGRTLKNESGRLTNADDLWKLIFLDERTKRIRTKFFTYIIDDYTWRFSETGEGYFTDFASKHALHANCSEYVRYAGQFHPRPRFGWDRCDDEWELVFDNWSGTYAPSLLLLQNLKDLLEFNFPGLNVVVHDYKDPILKESMENLKIGDEKLRNNALCLKSLVFTPSLSQSDQVQEEKEDNDEKPRNNLSFFKGLVFNPSLTQTAQVQEEKEDNDEEIRNNGLSLNGSAEFTQSLTQIVQVKEEDGIAE